MEPDRYELRILGAPQGTDFDAVGRVRFDHPFTEPQELAVDVPRVIADRVAAMVDGVVGRDQEDVARSAANPYPSGP